MTDPNDSAYQVGTVTTPNGDVVWGSNGVTKREMLAAMAMQGLLAHWDPSMSYDGIAEDAVIHADTLLAALADKKVRR